MGQVVLRPLLRRKEVWGQAWQRSNRCTGCTELPREASVVQLCSLTRMQRMPTYPGFLHPRCPPVAAGPYALVNSGSSGVSWGE
jgi:hypothetical protein